MEPGSRQRNLPKGGDEQLLALRFRSLYQQNQLIRFCHAELLTGQPFDGQRGSLECTDVCEKLLGLHLEPRYFLLQLLKFLTSLQQLDQPAVTKQRIEKR